MKGYGQFCPVAVACETLAERWTPLVVRELLYGSRRFNELRRGLPLVSPSLLTKRLRSLERAGIVERLTTDGRGVEYRLTPAGEELRPVIDAIAAWGTRWSQSRLDPTNLDAGLLMWDIGRRVRPESLPDRRVVVHFRLEGATDKRSRFWLVLAGGEADLCVTDPGFDVDVEVAGHVSALVRYWLSLAELTQLVRAEELRVTGPRRLVRALPTWFHRRPPPAARQAG